MSDIPASGGHWIEPRVPAVGGTSALARLTPYLLTDGSVEFLATGDTVPSGAVVATVTDSGSGYDQIVSGVTIGRRPVEHAGVLLLL